MPDTHDERGGDEEAPWSGIRLTAAGRLFAGLDDPAEQLRKQLAAATARAEKAEAGVVPLLRVAFAAGWHARSAATNGALATIGWDEREKAAKDWVRGFASDTGAADAARGGLSATETAVQPSEASGVELEFGKGAARPSEPEPPRDTTAWCWAPNPHTLLHCGRLRDHEPPHRRGERTWTDDDTTEDRR